MKFILFCLLLTFPSLTLAKRAAPPTQEVIVKKGEAYQGVKFPEGTILRVYVSGGAVASATLSQDFTLSGVKLLKGTSLQIYENGALFDFYPLEGQKVGELTFGKEQASSVRFSAAGKLEYIFLRNQMTIQGIRFGGAGQAQFYPNGKLQRASYLEAQEKDGLNIAFNSSATFYQDGKLQQVTLGKESRFGELKLKGDPNPANPGETEFWPNGKLKNAVLAKSASIDGYPCAPGRISFFESGKLQTLILGGDKKVMLNSYPKDAHAGDSLNLSEDGKVIGWGGK